MSDIGAYTLTMKSLENPPLVRIDDTLTARALPSVIFRDSIINFYPQAEIYIRDKQGIFSEKLFMIEGMQIETKFGREPIANADGSEDTLGGFVVNKYAWIKHDINQTEIKNHIAGDFIFFLVPTEYISDSPSTKAYKGTISDTVRKVITDTEGFNHTSDRSKIFIEATKTNQVTWYQAGRYSRFFLEMLSSRAVSSKYANSPYYTFLNNKGEFYFMSASAMLSQKSSGDYRIEETVESIRDPYVVKAYTIQSGGGLINKKNYKKNLLKILNDSTIETETNDIEKQKQVVDGDNSNTKDKLLILKNKSLGISKRITSIDNFGLYDAVDDIDIYTGWKNYLYINSILSYRMEIQIYFNPNICSGKVITLNVDKIIEKAYASEYSGAWLVMESTTHMDIEGFPIQRLLIGKPAITIDSNNPCVNDFM